MIAKKLKQCVDCEKGKLSYLWKSNPPLCRYHSSARNQKEVAVKVKSISDVDERFYEFVWKHRDHFCAECGATLKEIKRDYFHHILPKRKGAGGFPYFRHEDMNIILLCWSCHQKAESAISYPKMKVFGFCEGIKRQLLSNVGIEYVSH